MVAFSAASVSAADLPSVNDDLEEEINVFDVIRSLPSVSNGEPIVQPTILNFLGAMFFVIVVLPIWIFTGKWDPSTHIP